jgi:photosystem II stability/assembly factor-like uncharacterized protein
MAVVVDPVDPTVVYVGTDKRGIFKSMDCGATWTKINVGQNGPLLDSGMEWSMVIDPDEPNVLYSINGYGAESLWKTTDGGKNWRNLFPPESQVAKTVKENFTSIVSMDPTNPKHLVVSFHADCTGEFAPGCQAETMNGGDTWRLFKSPAGTTWENAAVMTLGEKTWLYTLPFDGLFQTEDSGATWTNRTPQGATGASGQRAYSLDGYWYVASYQGVIRSKDAKNWELLPNSGGVLSTLIIADTHLYATQQNGGSYYSAPVDDPTNWSEMETPGLPPLSERNQGGISMDYDFDHHILYSSNTTFGLWRMRTQ